MSDDPKHPNDMNRDELRELVSAMSWMALDLAQHLNLTNECLIAEHRPNAYKAAEKMAYELSGFPYHGFSGEVERTPGVAFMDGNGGWSV